MLTKITAHRGFAKGCKENTLQAFENALRVGADRIEFDVHLSKDGCLVVHHDYYVSTPAGASALIHEMRSEDLPFDVPTVSEVLNIAGDTVELEIEMKTPSAHLADELLALLSRFNAVSRAELTSPHQMLLSHVRSRSMKFKLGLFLQDFPEWMTPALGNYLICETLNLGEIDVAHCPPTIMTKELVSRIHAQGRQVHAANCNTRDDLIAAFRLGVDQLSTDELILAHEIRAEIQSG